MFFHRKKLFYGAVLVLTVLAMLGCSQPTDSTPAAWDITVNQTAHGAVAANPERAEAGAVIALKVTPEAGYRLKEASLKVNGGEVSLSGSGADYTFVMPKGKAVVEALFEALPAGYAVQIPAFEQGTITASPASAKEGDTVTLTVTPEAGYALKAGSLAVTDAGNNPVAVSAGSGTGHTFTMPAGDVAVSAEFEALPSGVYTVGIDPAISNGTVEADLASAEAGAVITLTVTPDSGYRLKADSLKVNNGEVAVGADYTFTMPAANITISAEFEAITYSITVEAMTNGAVAADKTSATPGTVITLTITPESNYRLKADSLKVNGGETAVSGSGAAYTFAMPAKDVTVSAEFALRLYNITVADSVTNGAIGAAAGGETVTVAAAGTEVTLTVRPDELYKLKDNSLKVNNGEVSLDGSGPYTFTMPAEDVTVSAVFVEDLTADIEFANTVNGDNADTPIDNEWEGDRTANQTWAMTAPEPLQGKIYFAAGKAQGQTITVGGADEAMVTMAADDEIVDGSTAGPELAVFTVEVEATMGMLFYGGDMNFTLTVSEEGKAPIAVAVTLTIVPDTSQGVTLYRVDDNDRLMSQNPKYFSGTSLDDLPIEPPLEVLKAQHLSRINIGGGYDHSAHTLNSEVVTTGLQDALAWINENAVDGAEYLVRVEQDEIVPKIVLSANFVDNVVIRLRGYGGNRTIALKTNSLGNEMLYDKRLEHTGNYTDVQKFTQTDRGNDGFINVGGFTFQTTRPETDMGFYKNSITLSIEDSIVISGSNIANKLISDNYSSLILLNSVTSTLVMREGSTLTGFNSVKPSHGLVVYSYSATGTRAGKFIMTGGTITGNTLTPIPGENPMYNAVIYGFNLMGAVQKSGGSISGNTYNGILVGSVLYDMENLQDPFEEDKIYLALPTTP